MKLTKAKVKEMLEIIDGADDAFENCKKAEKFLLPMNEVHFIASMATIFEAYGRKHGTTGTELAVRTVSTMLDYEDDKDNGKTVVAILKAILSEDDEDEEDEEDDE